MNHRNSKNGKRSNGVASKNRSNGVMACWSLGPHHSTTPSLHRSIPPTTPSLRSAFSLIKFIGRLANIVLGCFKVGNNSKCARPAGTADSSAAPALGRLAIAFSESQPSLRDLSASRVQPGVSTPGYYRSSLRDRRPARRRTNCRNRGRSVEAVNRFNRFNR